MKRTAILAATAAIALMSAPAAFADAHMMKYDAENTLAMMEDPMPAVEAAAGSQVYLMSGEVLGTVEEIAMQGDGAVDITMDTSGAEVPVGEDRMILSIAPDQVTASEGIIALSATADDIANNADTDGDSSGIAKISIPSS